MRLPSSPLDSISAEVRSEALAAATDPHLVRGGFAKNG